MRSVAAICPQLLFGSFSSVSKLVIWNHFCSFSWSFSDYWCIFEAVFIQFFFLVIFLLIFGTHFSRFLARSRWMFQSIIGQFLDSFWSFYSQFLGTLGSIFHDFSAAISVTFFGYFRVHFSPLLIRFFINFTLHLSVIFSVFVSCILGRFASFFRPNLNLELHFLIMWHQLESIAIKTWTTIKLVAVRLDQKRPISVHHGGIDSLN